MKKLLATTILTTFVVTFTFAAEGVGYDTYEQATEKAQEKDIPILIDFSGSDWCGWCIKLDNEVISKKAFKSFAEEEVAFYVADFPRNKKLPEEKKKTNMQLARKYNVRGFPTVLLLSPDGKVLARTGYRPGGSEKYVEHLRNLIEKNYEPDGE
jgi:thioredoxin-related protein